MQKIENMLNNGKKKKQQYLANNGSSNTVKTFLEEPSSLRTCWQKFSTLSQKYKNLFSQAKSSRFLYVVTGKMW